MSAEKVYLYILCGTKDLERLFDQVHIDYTDKRYCIVLPRESRTRLACVIKKELQKRESVRE